jgi:hypothetical protein
MEGFQPGIRVSDCTDKTDPQLEVQRNDMVDQRHDISPTDIPPPNLVSAITETPLPNDAQFLTDSAELSVTNPNEDTVFPS